MPTSWHTVLFFNRSRRAPQSLRGGGPPRFLGVRSPQVGLLECGLAPSSEQGEHTSRSPSVANAVRFHCRHRRTKKERPWCARKSDLSPGPARRRASGGPRPREEPAPRTALAPVPIEKTRLRVPYQSVTLNPSFLQPPSVGNRVLPPSAETRVQTMVTAAGL